MRSGAGTVRTRSPQLVVHVRLVIVVAVLAGGLALARPRASSAHPAPSLPRSRPLPPVGVEWERSGLLGVLACPAGMAWVNSPSASFCVDRYEASLLRMGPGGETQHWPGNRIVDGLEGDMMAVSRPGIKPQGYISGRQASVACASAGKRLCSLQEWTLACRGPHDTRYPYGKQRRAGACNDRFRGTADHPVLRLFQAQAAPGADPRSMWLPSWMNDPRLLELPHTVAPSGASNDCTNEYGVFDMVGNLHEWVADPDGVFAGGYFMDTLQNGEGCEYRTRAHGFDYHDYSTGFRCCVDAPSADLVR